MKKEEKTSKSTKKSSDKKDPSLTPLGVPSKTSSRSSENLKELSTYGEKEKEHLWNVKDVVGFAERKLNINLDQWQKDYINTEGNVAVRAGRQSGKSFAQSLRVALFALLNEKTQTLIIGAVERQAEQLFEKVMGHIVQLAKHQIKRDFKTRVELKNGAKIIALPAGRTGYGLRNYTIHKLVADEAHYIPEEVWTAVRPMLATTGGTMDLLSTPRGNEGFFYEVFQSDDFTTYHTKSEYCPRITKEFLEGERKRMSKIEFAQEYEAEFLDSLQAFFPKELIDSCIVQEYPHPIVPTYLGVDFAGHGQDPNAFVSIGQNGKQFYVLDSEQKEDLKAWETIQHIKKLDNEFSYKKIGVDDGGLGSPILDFMLTDTQFKRKAEGLNNARRLIDKEGRTKQLHGIEMYSNLKIMMEQGFIKFKWDEELVQSLTSIQYEVNKETKNVTIHGRYDHLGEAFKRASWLTQTKGLNLFVEFF